MIPLGSLNRTTVLIGEKGTGKSTWMVLDSIEFQAETGGFVIGHSPNGQIGAHERIQFHDSIRSLDQGVRRTPSHFHFIASGATPEDVIDYARTLSKDLRRQAHEREGVRFRENRPAPKGLAASPVLVNIDEGTHLRKGATNEEKSELEKLITSLRHEHVGITFSSQAPTTRTWLLLEQADRFRIFRYLHQWGGNALQMAGLDKETFARIRTLERFQYIAWDKDEPENTRVLRLPKPTSKTSL